MVASSTYRDGVGSSNNQVNFYASFCSSQNAAAAPQRPIYHTGYTPPCSFSYNGKEKDEESGFHYYGARYYWSELLTGWLSVDPLADKYPSISPYAYCAWNPVKLVDPDGQDWYEYTDNKTGEKKIAWTECHSLTQLNKKHKNAQYLGVTADDGNNYYGLMGDKVNKKDDKERYNMVRDLDVAIIKRAQREVNGEGVFDNNQFVDFSNVFTDNNGAAGNRMVRSYEYGGGEATIAMQKNMKGRFSPELHTSETGEGNRGMGGPMSGDMAIKCPRYEVRQGSGKYSIAGISFYKQPKALAQFRRIYSHISSGKVLMHSTKTGNNWNRSNY